MRRVCALWRRVLAFGCAMVMLPGVALARPTLNAPKESLGSVRDTYSAVSCIQEQAEYLGNDLATPEGQRLLTSFATFAIPYLGGEPEWVEGSELTIDAENVNERMSRISGGIASVEEAVNENLLRNGLEPVDRLPVVIIFKMGRQDINLTISPSVTEVESVDMIQVKTPLYSVSFRPADLAEDLDRNLVMTIRNVSETFDPLIEVSFQDESLESLAGYITLSLPQGEGDMNQMAIVNTDWNAFATVYNDATQTMDGKIKRPGVYRLVENRRKFNDLEGISSERAQAIEQLSSMGIVDGFPDGSFHPKDSITRGQFVKIIMNTVGKTNDNLKAPFSDVSSSQYYYHHAATAAKRGYMKGYEDGRFGGGDILTKAHICAVVGRILKAERGYSVPNAESYLQRYNDSVNNFARTEVALLLKLGVIDSYSGVFNGNAHISRGEIAEIVCRMLKWL